MAILHRTDRCDLSLFQLGLDLLDHCLNEALLIPFDYRLPKVFLFAYLYPVVKFESIKGLYAHGWQKARYTPAVLHHWPHVPIVNHQN